ncbi:metal-dependent hydrolase family protein [Phytoactinopolyspora halotolerans]|uniref:Amidohydrolase family protein n=1 Tax=Phytoactinopolyspora halotolerans TaxID=1981512 RepID=A0A6L9S1Z2_9ACTN|nr:amidohydrolase family protein [Phytoactinopolyspora halotolerans]NED98673.1 amidohydrolase family protein [Phytoactinopolyspora halotolerans]
MTGNVSAITTPTAYVHARLIDGTGQSPIDDATVVVEDDTITYAGPAPGAPELPPAHRMVDLAGRTLLPGFIDSHVHLGYQDASKLVLNNLDIHRSLWAFEVAERAQRTLDAGVTSVRDLGGLDAGFRSAQARGLLRAPRLQVAVRIMSHTGGHADFRLPTGVNLHELPGSAAEIVDTVAEARIGARRLMRDGADVIKVCATGGVSSPSDTPDDEGLTVEEIAAIADEAGRHGGRPVAAHAQGAAGIRNAVRGGVSSIEHGYLVDDQGIDLMLERGTYLVPTLSTFVGYHERKHLLPIEAYNAKRAMEERAFACVSEAIRRGVRVAMGTDAGISVHGTNLTELAQLVEVGMTPMAAISAGTLHAATLLGVADRLGTVQAGMLADLVACDGDPLQDIGVLADPANVALVVQNGQVVKGALGAP